MHTVERCLSLGDKSRTHWPHAADQLAPIEVFPTILLSIDAFRRSCVVWTYRFLQFYLEKAAAIELAGSDRSFSGHYGEYQRLQTSLLPRSSCDYLQFTLQTADRHNRPTVFDTADAMRKRNKQWKVTHICGQLLKIDGQPSLARRHTPRCDIEYATLWVPQQIHVSAQNAVALTTDFLLPESCAVKLGEQLVRGDGK